jgi:predicted ATP-dependent endonuclease of OLD family
MLFSHRSVICEGKDDVYAVRNGLAKIGADLDSHCVSVINAGSVSAMPEYARMASDLQIPWFGVTDEDLHVGGPANAVTEAKRQELEALKGATDATAVWKGDLERCLGKSTGKAKPTWQAKSIEPLSIADLTAKHPDYMYVCQAIHRWIGGEIASPIGENAA